MSAAKTKPRLVIPSAPALPGTTPAYARGFRRGAIDIRRDVANECRRAACVAAQRGDDGEAFRLHAQADQSEREIERLTREMAEIHG